MKSKVICEDNIDYDARIYHKALIWPGTFVATGAISLVDARELGLKVGKLSGDDIDTGIMDARKKPHPFEELANYLNIRVSAEAIKALTDDQWIDALKHQSLLLSPNLKLTNIRIIDRGFDRIDNMMFIKYLADVNLKLFYKSNDWSANEAENVEPETFKILKKKFNK